VARVEKAAGANVKKARKKATKAAKAAQKGASNVVKAVTD